MKRSSALGIFQSDIIVRSAIAAALDDIRAKPWLLDFIFQSLLNDPLTRRYYGEEEINTAKDWFLNNDIPVKMAYRLDGVVAPLIALTLTESSEDAATLGDVHYEPVEDIDPIEINVTKPALTFTPTAFDPLTGTVTVASSVDLSFIFSGMIVREKATSKTYVIDSVGDHQFVILPSSPLSLANLTRATIESSNKLQIVSLESIVYREGFRIDLFVSGNHTHLLYLHSILVFALNRYKQSLLESRGFERSQVSSTSLGKFERSESEIIFTRAINLTGYVRQYWPKEVRPRIDGMYVGPGLDVTDLSFGGIKILGAEAGPVSVKTDELNQGWSVIDEDTDSLG